MGCGSSSHLEKAEIIECPHCASCMRVFSAPGDEAYAKSSATHAICCPGCSTLVTPQQVADAELRRKAQGSHAMQWVRKEARAGNRWLTYEGTKLKHGLGLLPHQAVERLGQALDSVPFERINALLEFHKSAHAVVLHRELRTLVDSRSVVLRSVETCPVAVRFADSHWHADAEVMLAACSRDGALLEYGSATIRADEEIVFMACSQFGQALQYAAAALQDTELVVEAAVAQDGCALQWASARLKADIVMALLAVAQQPLAIRFVDPLLLDDPLDSADSDSDSGPGGAPGPRPRKDQWRLEIAERAVLSGLELDELAVMAIDWPDADWRRLVLFATKLDGRLLGRAGPALQADREVAAAAVAQTPAALRFVGDRLFVGATFVTGFTTPEAWARAQSPRQLAAGVELALIHAGIIKLPPPPPPQPAGPGAAGGSGGAAAERDGDETVEPEEGRFGRALHCLHLATRCATQIQAGWRGKQGRCRAATLRAQLMAQRQQPGGGSRGSEDLGHGGDRRLEADYRGQAARLLQTVLQAPTVPAVAEPAEPVPLAWAAGGVHDAEPVGEKHARCQAGVPHYRMKTAELKVGLAEFEAEAEAADRLALCQLVTSFVHGQDATVQAAQAEALRAHWEAAKQGAAAQLLGGHNHLLRGVSVQELRRGYEAESLALRQAHAGRLAALKAKHASETARRAAVYDQLAADVGQLHHEQNLGRWAELAASWRELASLQRFRAAKPALGGGDGGGGGGGGDGGDDGGCAGQEQLPLAPAAVLDGSAEVAPDGGGAEAVVAFVPRRQRLAEEAARKKAAEAEARARADAPWVLPPLDLSGHAGPVAALVQEAVAAHKEEINAIAKRHASLRTGLHTKLEARRREKLVEMHAKASTVATMLTAAADMAAVPGATGDSESAPENQMVPVSLNT
eukprot:SAG22_NODE_51_length_24458_cov_19.853161_4_plen_916_part_00